MSLVEEIPVLDVLTSSTVAHYETAPWTKMPWVTSPIQPSASGASFISFSTTTGSYYSTSFTRGCAVRMKYSTGSQLNERYGALWLCMAPGSHNGYRFKFINTTEAAEHKWKAIIYKVTGGVETELVASVEQTTTLEGAELGFEITPTGNLIAWWKPAAGEWTKLCEHTDTTYTSGNVGFDGSGSNPHFKEFRAGQEVALSITTPGNQTTVHGTPVTLNITSTGATSFSANALPVGLTINPVTGQITGTPTNGEVPSVKVTAHNATEEKSVTFTWTITGTTQTVTTMPESEVRPSKVQLNGISNPEATQTEVFFEWGLTTSYGHATNAKTIGAASNPVSFFSVISGLEPNTVYHYRAVAVSGLGTVHGADEVVTTKFSESPLIYPTLIQQAIPAVDWRWYLANSSDLELLGELDAATGRKITLALNSAESASFAINTLETVAGLIKPISTAVAAYRNGTLVWSGPVWTVNEAVPEGNVNVSCMGWYELFNHRLLKCGPNAPITMPTTTAIAQTYAGMDQTAIIAELILRTLADSAFISNIMVGTVPSTVANGGQRNITYQQFQNIGQAITAMANVENGFDFRIDPATLLFNMYYGEIAPDIPGSTLRGRGKHRPNTVFGYRWGPSNVEKLSRTIDGSKLVNDAYALGQYGLGAQQEPRSIGEYGKFTAQASLTEVVSSTILAAYAAAEVIVKSQPQIIYTFDLLPFHNLQDVPQPFDDFDIGDIVHLGSSYGRMQIPEPGTSSTAFPVRMFAFDVEISDNGVEQVKNAQTVYTTSA